MRMREARGGWVLELRMLCLLGKGKLAATYRGRVHLLWKESFFHTTGSRTKSEIRIAEGRDGLY